MNLFGLSPGELLLILMVAMVVLGPEKLPEVAASLGKWIREFRRATEELSAQFAGENPLLEIQRALSLVDEPAPVAPPEPLAVEDAPLATATDQSGSTTQAPSGSVPQISGPIHSDYFTRPWYYPTITDAWTHGSLPDNSHRNGHASPNGARFIADEWTHGVPVPRLVPTSECVEDSAPSSEPVLGISPQIAFEPPTEPAHDQSAEIEASTPLDSEEPAPSATVDDAQPPGATASADALDEPTKHDDVAAIKVPSSNGITQHHPDDSTLTQVPVVAGDGREGDSR